MRFIDRLGEYLTQIDLDMYKLREGLDGIDWGHACDCEFCEHEGEDADPKADEKAERFNGEYRELLRLRKRLEAYGKAWRK